MSSSFARSYCNLGSSLYPTLIVQSASLYNVIYSKGE